MIYRLLLPQCVRNASLPNEVGVQNTQGNPCTAREETRTVVEELRSMNLKEATKKVEDGSEEPLTYCDFPSKHWTRIRAKISLRGERRNLPPYSCGEQFSEQQLCSDAGLCPATSCG